MDPEFRRTLERIQQERAQYFTPRWFGRLLAAKLSLPDSFWIGLFGPLLAVVPVTMVLATLAMWVDPAAGRPVLSGLTALLGLYWGLVARAVLIAARRSPQAGGWRWAAVIVAMILAALALVSGIGGLF